MVLRELKTLTYEGEVAHEADGITVGCSTPLRPNLFSPECPTRGLPKGGKPTYYVANCSSNNDSAFRCRKAKRTSESELHGIVSFDLAALLTRGGESSRVVGPSHRVVHGDQQSRRSYKQGPSLTNVVPSELGHVARRSAADCGGGANPPDCPRRANRCGTGDKG